VTALGTSPEVILKHSVGKRNRSLAVKLLVIAGLLAVIYWAGLRAYAAWHFLAAQSVTNTMLESGRPDQPGIDEANRSIALALKIFPRQPDYLDLAGRLQEMHASQVGVVGKQQRELLESAADYYRAALSVRPLWPYSWSNLLGVKDKLGQTDQEFKLAMRRSIETGPWEPQVQLAVLTTGLRHWSSLGGLEKGLVRDKVKDALIKQPREVFNIVKSFGRPDLVCDGDVDYQQISQWCSQELASTPN